MLIFSYEWSLLLSIYFVVEVRHYSVFFQENSFLFASSLMLFQHHNIFEYIVFLNELERVLKLKLNKSQKQKSTVCNNYTNFEILCPVCLCICPKTFVSFVVLENYIYVFAKYCCLIMNTTKHQNILLDHLISTQNNIRKHKLFSAINNK